MGKFVIRLDDLRFHSRIGVMEQERQVGNEFSVSIRFSLDAAPFRSEVLETTVSYADVYEVVTYVMKREWLLLESAAKDIATRVGERWPQIEEIRVRINKLSPPIDSITGPASVEYIS